MAFPWIGSLERFGNPKGGAVSA